MKIIILFFIAIIFSVLYSSVFQYRPLESAIDTLYTVASILFSVGMGLVVSIIPNGIKNLAYAKRIRMNLNRVRNCFFYEFLLITVIHLFHNLLPACNFTIFSYVIIFEPVILEIMLLCLSFVYYFLNFLDIQKLNNDIFEATNRE